MHWQARGKAPGKVARGSDGFGKLSSDEKSREEAWRAELTVCCPQAVTSGRVGIVSYKSAGSVQALVGTVGSRT